MSADPDLVAIWVQGWAKTRRLPRPVRDGAAWRVDVNWPDQKTRYVFDHMSDAVVDLARRIDEPFVFLKVFASEADVAACLPAAWTYPHPGYFMTHEAPVETRSTPAGHRLTLQEEDGVFHVAIIAADGSEAATGHVTCIDGNAIYNRIETAPAHQRRGLGGALMAALGEAAQRRGVHRHILVATPQGKHLYESLGWTLGSDYATAVLP